MVVSAIQPLKKLNASNTGNLTGEVLSFKLSQVMLHADWLYFYADFNLILTNERTRWPQKMNGNFYCTAWEGIWVKN